MQYKIRMLVSGGYLEADKTYWAEEFPSNPDWMFAENLRLPKSKVNSLFVYEGLRLMIPGTKQVIYLNETNRGYEVNVAGMKPFHLNKYSKKTFFLERQNLYITLKHEGDKVTHEVIEGIQQEYA